MSRFARSERQELADLLLAVGPAAPTLDEGWTTRDLAAHLVVRERRPDAAAGILLPPLRGHGERVRTGLAAHPYERLVELVRRPPWWSPVSNPLVHEPANLLEFFIHHEDVRRASPDWHPRALATDLQAALGLSQLGKLAEFGAARRRNWRRLRDGLEGVPGLILPRPTPGSDPSWFGFVITVEPDAGFTRGELTAFLEARRIGTRVLFAGNLTRHPAFVDQRYRVVGELTNSDLITDHTFWIGVYPGLTTEMIEYMARSVREFVAGRR